MSIGIIRRRSSQALSTGPPIVASSKYQILMGDLTLQAISSTAKANRTYPSGSPCWTPVSERLSHYQSQDGCLWRTLLMLNEELMGLLMNKRQGNDIISQY